MTTLVEKQCIMAGLQRISEDIALLSEKIEEDELTLIGSLSSNEGANIFEEKDRKATVIVPALAPDMGELYADGQIKLLALNV